MKIPVTVIVPIYGVEAFVERCVRSLFGQSLSNIEYIFVNDCTRDQSMRIINRLITEYEIPVLNIKIISHDKNRGLAAARNSGLAAATGDYIFHCDADDWIEKNAMEDMYILASKKQADMVWCDWFLSFRNNERYMSQLGTEYPLDYLKAMLSGKLKFNVWNKLVKRDLYLNNEITFPECYDMGEDMTMIKLAVFAKEVAYLPKALYHYVQLNTNSYTKKISEKRLCQILYNTNCTIDFIQEKLGNGLDKEIQFFKLNIKLPFLISNDKKSYIRWLEWYPEANKYIDQNAFPFRTRLIQKMAMRRWFWVLKLYYWLVIRVIYGIIYK